MKTYDKYMQIIRSGKITESELIYFRKAINHCSKLSFGLKESLLSEFEFIAKTKEFRLTKTHQQKGLEWLRSKTFKLNGMIRKNSPLRPFEIDVLNSFKKFTCVGLYNLSVNARDQYVPIYRCYGKTGYFDYICKMWGEIEVIGIVNETKHVYSTDIDFDCEREAEL